MYLTKYCSHLSVPILLSLEASIHKFYVEHPHLNWNITWDEVDHLFKNDKHEKEKLNKVLVQARIPSKHGPTYQVTWGTS